MECAGRVGFGEPKRKRETVDVYERETARKRFLQVGCSPEEADTLVDAGIDPDIVGARARDAVPFVSAAVFHDLADPNVYLEIAGGDPDEAWREWARSSVDGPADEGEPEGEEDEGDEPVHGWLSAYVRGEGPGAYVIDLCDDLGMPGNASYVTELRFSVPVAVSGTPGDQDALVVTAATERLVEYGCVLESEFRGSGDSYSVRVRVSERAPEWLEDQRSPAEKLELLVAGLHALRDHASLGGTERDSLRIDNPPKPRPGPPGGTPQGGAGTTTVEWTDREAFLEAVAAHNPRCVSVQRYQGGWAGRLEEAEGVEHPGLEGLRDMRAEAARREGELSGFTAEFRAGAEIHGYRVQADWVSELDGDLRRWEREVRAVRDEQARFPHLEQWGRELCRALLEDERFLGAAEAADQNRRGADLARTMFGPDCPVRSVYIRRALAEARAGRAELLVERRREQWRAVIPDWAERLAASSDFRQGSTAERAMLASNLLYAQHPEADTPELVRLLRTAACDLLARQEQVRQPLE
jgi:hypothetical protein